MPQFKDRLSRLSAMVLVLFGILIPGFLAVDYAPVAHADDSCVMDCVSTPGSNQWPGQLMPTWDTPGTYGGWTNDPVLCDPSTLKCSMVSQP